MQYVGGDYIYAIQGDKSIPLWRYSISGNSWQTMEPAPDKIGTGGAIGFTGEDYIYLMQGDKATGFWRYLAAPPKYDLVSTAGATTLSTRIQLSGSTATILFWDFD